MSDADLLRARISSLKTQIAATDLQRDPYVAKRLLIAIANALDDLAAALADLERRSTYSGHP
jgi:hypothetical protein